MRAVEKFTFCFVEITHEPLRLEKKFRAVKDYGHAYTFCVNHCFIRRSVSIRRWNEFLGYVGTNAEPLCVEFCNFV
jgi:hypothetical protein